MTLNELIRELTDLQRAHGDARVMFCDSEWGNTDVGDVYATRYGKEPIIFLTEST